MAAPTLDVLDIQGKDITADAMLTQREFARYLVQERNAHYHLTVKGNQSTLLEDIALAFQERQEPDFVQKDPPDHGRLETRKIWTTTELNPYLNFPHVQQAYVIEQEFIDKKTGEYTHDLVYGITSRPPEEANAQRLLTIKRGHWNIESFHNIIDWNFNEDRSCIRKGHGPENMTRLRRFAISLIKSKKGKCVAQKMRQLSFNTRMVFDYLKMTKNSCPQENG